MILQYAEVLGWPGHYLVSVQSIVGQAPSITSSLWVSDMGDSETSKPTLVPFASATKHSFPQSLRLPSPSGMVFEIALAASACLTMIVQVQCPALQHCAGLEAFT